jgi:hypothetical protein
MCRRHFSTYAATGLPVYFHYRSSGGIGIMSPYSGVLAIPGPQLLGTGGTLSVVGSDHWDRGHQPPK